MYDTAGSKKLVFQNGSKPLVLLYNETFQVSMVSVCQNLYKYETVYRKEKFILTLLVSCKMRLLGNFSVELS